ncbi:hypothetical protein F5B19DRAFT_55700 [Rostrohypoxylon terebratum]|nr:hypothetical protein F5B19DRAFT_55700 [Rostrohypoxylon terebratum]
MYLPKHLCLMLALKVNCTVATPPVSLCRSTLHEPPVDNCGLFFLSLSFSNKSSSSVKFGGTIIITSHPDPTQENPNAKLNNSRKDREYLRTHMYYE